MDIPATLIDPEGVEYVAHTAVDVYNLLAAGYRVKDTRAKSGTANDKPESGTKHPSK